MRKYFAAVGLCACLCTCSQSIQLPAAPTDRLDYPTSLKYAVTSDGQEILYVTNSNLDVAYQTGSLMVANLSGLPPFGSSPATPANVFNLGPSAADGGRPTAAPQVLIDGFSGVMDSWPTGTPNQVRLFIPTRENNNLFVVDATDTSLACVRAPDGGVADASSDCTASGILMYETEQIRQEQPYCAKVVGSSVYVSPLESADDPPLSQTNYATYLAQLDVASPFSTTNFYLVGEQSIYEMAEVESKLYLTSAYPPAPNVSTACVAALPLRQFDPNSISIVPGADGVARTVFLSPVVEVNYTFGTGTSCDGTKLYVITQAPDAIAIVDISQATSAGSEATSVVAPVVRLDALPQGPSEMRVVCRPGLGDLVVVTSITSNSVSFYDAGAGAVVSLRRGFDQPFAIAVATGGKYAPGARVFVGAHQRSTIDVIDIPDLTQPEGAQLVAHLGCPYGCIAAPSLPECFGVC
jgi:hypothetical protein